jgi:dihydroorotase-like cyclic amidohydrolase
VIEEKDIKSKFPELNPYLGKKLIGRVDMTYLKGQKVWDHKLNHKSFKTQIGKVLV